MTYNLTNIKTKKSRNGFAMSCTLQIDNIDVADFFDKGDGSHPTVSVSKDFNRAIMFQRLEEKINELPEVYIPEYDTNMKIDTSLFIDLLHSALVNKSDFKLLTA